MPTSFALALLFLPLLDPKIEPSTLPPATAPRPAEATPSAGPAQAQQAWKEGQQAMEAEQFDQAIGQFQLSLRLDPKMAQAHLSLAAAYLGQGEDARAIPHLAQYLRERPHHLSVRVHYAELLFRLSRPKEARGEFEHFISDVQDHARLAEEHLIPCFTRLMEICEQTGDVYGTHLNRGIGLYHLARQRRSMKDPDASLVAEGLFFKAAAELTLARLHDPEAARPCWYLYEVWEQLAQKQPSRRWLRRTEACSLLDDLTPLERRDLYLAWCRLEQEERQK